ncbi:RICIN domain-containing protein [bacterium]|nr:RICIN domain-containing protein [bacterium]
MGGIIQKALAEKDRDKELQLTHGLHFFGRLDVNASGKLKSLLKKLGTTETSLPLRGDFDAALLARLKKGTKVVLKQAKKGGKLLRKSLVNIRVPFPKIKIPGIPANLTIHQGKFVIRSYLDTLGKKHFESVFQGGMDLDMKGSSKKLSADVDIEFESVKANGEFDFKMSAEASAKWHPPHVDWLELDDIKIKGEFGGSKSKGKHFDMTIEAISKIDNKELDLDIDFHIANKKIKDFLVRLHGDLELKSMLKHAFHKEISAIPTLTIKNIEISPVLIEATFLFKKETTAIAIFDPDPTKPISKDNFCMTILHDKYKLSDYIPSLAHTPADAIEFDKALLMINLHNKEFNIKISSLPKTLRNILNKSLISKDKKPESSVKVSPGIGFSGLIESKASGTISKVLKEIGLKETMVPINGIFSLSMLKKLNPKSGSQKLMKDDHIDIRAEIPGFHIPKTPKDLKWHDADLVLRTDHVRGGKSEIITHFKSGMTFPVGKGKALSFDTDLEFDLEGGKNKEFQFILSAEAKAIWESPQNIKWLKFDDIHLTSVIKESRKNKEFAMTMEAVCELGGKKLDTTAIIAFENNKLLDIDFDMKGKIDILDLISHISHHPISGMPSITLEELEVSNHVIKTKILFRGEKTEVLFFTPGKKAKLNKKKLCFAVLHNELKLSHYIPSLAGTLVDEISLDDSVLIVVPKGTRLMPNSGEVPPELAAYIKDSAPRPSKIKPLPSGISFLGLLEAQKSGEISTLLKKLGISQNKMPLRGTFSSSILSKLSKKKKQAKAACSKAIATATDEMDLQAVLPKLTPPGLPTDIVFKESIFKIFSSKEKSGKIIKIGIFGGIDVTLTKKEFSFDGSIEFEKDSEKGFNITITGDCKQTWEKPHGISWISLDEIKLDMSIGKDAQGKTDFKFDLDAKAQISKHEFDADFSVAIVSGKFKNFMIKIPTTVHLADIPIFKKIPGIKEFSFSNLEITPNIVAATMIWGRHNITSKGVLYHTGKNLTILYRIEEFKLSDLVSIVKKTPLKSMVVPNLIIGLSTKGIPAKNLGQLPPEIQDLLKGMLDDKQYQYSVPNGISLMMSFDPAKIDPQLGKGLKHLGIHDPLVIAGAIEGIFGGPPWSIDIFAYLPEIKIPSTVPKCFQFAKDAQGSFVLKIISDGDDFDFLLGIKGGMHMKVGKEKILLSTTMGVEVSDDGIEIDVLGQMQGKWKNAFGLYGLDLENLLVEFDVGMVDAAIGVSLAATMYIEGLKYKTEIETKLEPEAYGFPKELIFEYEAAELGLPPYIAMGEVVLKTVAHDASLILKVLKGLSAKEKKEIKKVLNIIAGSGSIAMKMATHTLPLFMLKDVKVWLATPGAICPYFPDISGMGVGVKGSLYFWGKDLADVDCAISMKGLKIYGDVKIKQIGPLKIDEAVIDIAASFTELPHMKIKCKMELLFFSEYIDIEISKDGFKFELDTEIKDLAELKFWAYTVGTNLLHIKEFDFGADFHSDFGAFLRNEVGKEADIAFKTADVALHNAQKKLEAAKAVVETLDTKIAAARVEAKREIANLEKPIIAAEKKVENLNTLAARAKHNRDKAHWYQAWKKAKYEVEYLAYKAAYDIAEGVLKLLQKGLNKVPIDLFPKVAVLILEKTAAIIALSVAEDFVKLAEVVTEDVQKAIDSLIKDIANANILIVKKAGFHGKINKANLLDPSTTFDLDIVLFGEEINPPEFTFHPMKPKFTALIKSLGKKVIDFVRGKHEKKAASNLANKPPIVIKNDVHVQQLFLVSKMTGMFMTVKNKSKKDGAFVTQTPPTGNDEQLWHLVKSETTGYTNIINNNSNKCLSLQPQSPVKKEGKYLSKKHKKWHPRNVVQHGYSDIPAMDWIEIQDKDGYYQLQNRDNNKFLSLHRPTSWIGEKYVLKKNLTSWKRDEELFHFVDATTMGFGALSPLGWDEVMQPLENKDRNNTLVVLANRNKKEKHQKWALVPYDDTYFRLINGGHGRCLDAITHSHRHHRKKRKKKITGHKGYKLRQSEDGYVTMVSAHTGRGKKKHKKHKKKIIPTIITVDNDGYCHMDSTPGNVYKFLNADGDKIPTLFMNIIRLGRKERDSQLWDVVSSKNSKYFKLRNKKCKCFIGLMELDGWKKAEALLILDHKGKGNNFKWKWTKDNKFDPSDN